MTVPSVPPRGAPAPDCPPHVRKVIEALSESGGRAPLEQLLDFVAEAIPDLPVDTLAEMVLRDRLVLACRVLDPRFDRRVPLPGDTIEPESYRITLLLPTAVAGCKVTGAE